MRACSMSARLGFPARSRAVSDTSAHPPNSTIGDSEMNAHVKGFALFLAYSAVHALVVRPVLKQMNIPVLKDL